ncbi:tetratricopeptide repeat protein, partial [Pseudofrankia sp. BMG5.36]|uniref:tetratricopeptide repeat protein n=2 Tax=unclassified Pseudofrankia TaxID=2994372 RepID=UPI001A7E0887
MATLARLPGFAGTDGFAYDVRDRAARWLADLYPPPADRPDSRWGGVVPDRVAEHFVARAVEQDEGADRPGQLLGGASAGQIYQAFTVLARASATRHNLADLVYRLIVSDPASRAVPAVRVAIETPSPPELLRALTDAADQLDAARLADVIDELPRYSTRLLDLAAELQQTSVTRLRKSAFSDDALSNLAHALTNLSARLGELGRWEEGLAASEEAVDVYRRLAEARPEEFLSDLAGALTNLSVDLGGLGRLEEGLAANEEALAVYRRLAEDRPEAFLPDLAMSLTNLSVDLGELGRWEEGLAAIEEAVAIRRRLAEARPEAYLPNLA